MKSISAGKLKHFVRFRRHLDVPNGQLGLDETYPTEFDRWAGIEQISAATYYGAKQVGESVTHWIVIRRGTGTRPQDLTTDWVIEHDGQRYRVSRARTHPDDDRFTAIEAFELGAI